MLGSCVCLQCKTKLILIEWIEKWELVNSVTEYHHHHPPPPEKYYLSGLPWKIFLDSRMSDCVCAIFYTNNMNVLVKTVLFWRNICSQNVCWVVYNCISKMIYTVTLGYILSWPCGVYAKHCNNYAFKGVFPVSWLQKRRGLNVHNVYSDIFI